jgi:hypothetical protein
MSAIRGVYSAMLFINYNAYSTEFVDGVLHSLASIYAVQRCNQSMDLECTATATCFEISKNSDEKTGEQLTRIGIRCTRKHFRGKPSYSFVVQPSCAYMYLTTAQYTIVLQYPIHVPHLPNSLINGQQSPNQIIPLMGTHLVHPTIMDNINHDALSIVTGTDSTTTNQPGAGRTIEGVISKVSKLFGRKERLAAPPAPPRLPSVQYLSQTRVVILRYGDESIYTNIPESYEVICIYFSSSHPSRVEASA